MYIYCVWQKIKEGCDLSGESGRISFDLPMSLNVTVLIDTLILGTSTKWSVGAKEKYVELKKKISLALVKKNTKILISRKVE